MANLLLNAVLNYWHSKGKKLTSSELTLYGLSYRKFNLFLNTGIKKRYSIKF